MSIYISPNNEYPRFQGDIKLASPDWNIGDTLPTGWKQVEETPIPEPNSDQVLEEGFPVETNGKWYRSWNVRPLTEAERAKRDAPATAKAKLKALGLTDVEIEALSLGIIR